MREPSVRRAHVGSLPGPVRTCVGCRQRATRGELLRVVARSGLGGQDDSWHAVPDPTGSAPGRGAHLHPDVTCLARAERSRAFVRALRHDAGTRGPLHLEALRDHLAAAATPRPDETGSISS